ncbi:MAG: HAD-IA family hydrolase [Eubacteriales bacterium]
MPAYQNVFFDLDGTLTDSKEGIIKAAAYALQCYGIAVPDLDMLSFFIGPPLLETFKESYGFSHEDAVGATLKFRDYYGETGKFENRVYDGVTEMLQLLRAQGCRLSVATSKPYPLALDILDHFGLLDYFDFVAGALEFSRLRKDEVVAYALQKLQVTDPATVLMVGDRKHDVVGARACGMDALGVLYGYGSRAELTGAGATALAETPREVYQYIINPLSNHQK